MKTFFIGIDPGKKGGIAYIDTKENYQGAETYSAEALIGLCEEIRFSEKGSQVMCCLEQVHAMPKQGGSSTFTFGKIVGEACGILKAFRIPYQEISPQRWKREFGLSSDKKKSIEVCCQLFPSVSLIATEKSKVMHDGMAEALLMAEYARRKL